MIARDLMNSDFPFVTVDADLDYVAKLLNDCGLGAIPVVDAQLSPIGIVTRSNLEEKHDDQLAELGEIPAFLLKNRRKPIFRANGRALRDVMTTPAISVQESASLPDIAQMMESHKLKRIPVVNGQKIVGLILRREVTQALVGQHAAPAAPMRPVITLAQHKEPDSCGLATAEEFRELVAAHERAIDSEQAEHRRMLKEAQEERIRDLAKRRLTEGQWRDMLNQARRNAATGNTEAMLIRFPSQLCTDGGRAINAPDPRWPETLQGEPADIFRRWRNELQPRGFKLAAQIVDFPDGLPGDAALFLIWGSTSG